jgi:aldehyde:ferredoxin oxidoreductase
MTQRLGSDTAGLAMQSKGIELPLHDPRMKPMLGLSYAVSPAGPDDLSVEHDSDYDMTAPDLFLDRSAAVGILERLETTDLGPRKVRMMRILEDVFSFMNCAGICKFAAVPCRYYTFSQVVALATAATGWEVSLWELMRLGERRIALQKLFNQRAGIGPEADTLPARAFEPIDGGPRAGICIDRAEFDRAKVLYYEMRGWDAATGVPSTAKLVELGVDRDI